MGSALIREEEIIQIVDEGIRKTINKFRENPLYFFTESDIHSYFFYCIYSSRLEVVKNGIRIGLAHREYPTNFRYAKKELLNKEFTKPYELKEKKGDRGNYDMVIINPKFAWKYSSNIKDIKHIINKKVTLLEIRNDGLDSTQEELIYAIEFKYVINNSKSFIDEVKADNKKLKFAKEYHAKNAVNLVFCNIKDGKNVKDVRREVKKTCKRVRAVFVQSYYDENKKKKTPVPIWND